MVLMNIVYEEICKCESLRMKIGEKQYESNLKNMDIFTYCLNNGNINLGL